MRRRKLLLLLGAGIPSWPHPGEAQNRPWRLGLLGDAPDTFWEVIRGELANRGYREGADFVVDYGRVGGHYELLQKAAERLVREGADVIVASGNSATHAAKAATSTVPIVMVVGADPMAEGLVASLARPGGNITGIASLAQGLSPKRLELVQELLPGITQVGVLGNASSGSYKVAVYAIEEAARVRGLAVRTYEVVSQDDIVPAVSAIASDRIRAFIVLPSQLLFRQRTLIATHALRLGLCAISADRDLVEAGGLASYSPNFAEMYRRAADYVIRLRKGGKPSDMPIEQPTRFEFVINAKTARAIGVQIPPTTLARTDEVIE